MVRRELATMPVGSLKQATDGRLRLAALERARFRSVLDVLDVSPSGLRAVPGVGEQTANQAVAAARQIARAVDDGLQVRIDLDPSNRECTALVQALSSLRETRARVAQVSAHLERLSAELPSLLNAAHPAGNRLGFFFRGARRKAEATAALAALQHWSGWIAASRFEAHLGHIADARSIDPNAAWRDFERNAPEHYGILGEIVDLKLDVEAAEGFLPAEIVANVNAQALDDAFCRVSLRGYQAFGARFALVQRHCILGDEMGLGKTIQAIAAMAHLRSTGSTHFMVVCPASVLVNWTREIAQRSALPAYRLHGQERPANLRRWVRSGGVAVTTFESLASIAPPAVDVALLVVDEAHYVKNPSAKRSRATVLWVQRAERTLFMTGTPMENRVEEFRNLVGYLRPDIAGSIRPQDGLAGGRAFRQAVAPVYLRRNQEDVLTELPELVQVDEWEEFGGPDFAAYQHAVLSGNFQAMRRAAFAVEPHQSAKMRRLLELADEANANGHKVVVFSHFRDVLDAVHAALGSRAHGPLTGSVPAQHRQVLVDRFSNDRGPAVLVSQIQAGGVGLNIQSASVAILCEPQVKPTLEAQAIARLHRMGQVRTVQVHRLLIADSVDQRMLELLDTKRRLFDEYARTSVVADAAPEAVDISETALAKMVVEAEQERLAAKLMAEYEAREAAQS